MAAKLLSIELKSRAEMVGEAIAKVRKRLDEGELIEKILIVTASAVPDDSAIHHVVTTASGDMTCADELWLLENAKWKLMSEVRG